MFTLTSAAAQQIRQAAQDSGAEHLALRVAARRMPDGGLDYGMGFDDASEQDMRLMIEDVAVVLSEPNARLLEDTVLDFVELESGQFNFIFIDQNPTAATGCGSNGCGSGSCSSGGCGSQGVPQ